MTTHLATQYIGAARAVAFGCPIAFLIPARSGLQGASRVPQEREREREREIGCRETTEANKHSALRLIKGSTSIDEREERKLEKLIENV